MLLTRFAAAALLCALALLPVRVMAAPTTITVVGQGSASSMPDVATVSLSIRTIADTASQATSDNNAIYDRLIRALGGLGISGTAVRTTSFNVNYNPPPQPQPGAAAVRPEGGPYGYTVSRGIAATAKSTSQVGKLIDAAIAAGVNNIDSVDFGIGNPDRQKAIALREAVADARAQAQAIAAAAGMRIVGIKTMDVGAVNVPLVRGVQADTYAAKAAVPTVLPPSNVSTQTSVTITFNAQ